MFEISPRGRRRPEHGLDVFEIPLDAADAAVDVRQRLGMWLADLPDQEQSDQLPLLAQPLQA